MISQGFVLVKDFFPPKRLDVVREAVNDLVDQMANKLYDAGKIKSKKYFLIDSLLKVKIDMQSYCVFNTD